jgi:hypothetical protein
MAGSSNVEPGQARRDSDKIAYLGIRTVTSGLRHHQTVNAL